MVTYMASCSFKYLCVTLKEVVEGIAMRQICVSSCSYLCTFEGKVNDYTSVPVTTYSCSCDECICIRGQKYNQCVCVNVQYQGAWVHKHLSIVQLYNHQHAWSWWQGGQLLAKKALLGQETALWFFLHSWVQYAIVVAILQLACWSWIESRLGITPDKEIWDLGGGRVMELLVGLPVKFGSQFLIGRKCWKWLQNVKLALSENTKL